MGDLSSDLVTLGVVFRADEAGEYKKDCFIVGGDIVPPLDPDIRGLRFLSRTEYRSRLEKVGITNRYLKLLTLPQRKLAELCRRNPVELFDDLYDIIGCRQALEEWKKRLEELAARVPGCMKAVARKVIAVTCAIDWAMSVPGWR